MPQPMPRPVWDPINPELRLYSEPGPDFADLLADEVVECQRIMIEGVWRAISRSAGSDRRRPWRLPVRANPPLAHALFFPRYADATMHSSMTKRPQIVQARPPKRVREGGWPPIRSAVVSRDPVPLTAMELRQSAAKVLAEGRLTPRRP